MGKPDSTDVSHLARWPETSIQLENFIKEADHAATFAPTPRFYSYILARAALFDSLKQPTITESPPK